MLLEKLTNMSSSLPLHLVISLFLSQNYELAPT